MKEVFAPSSSGIDFFLIYSPITAQEEDVLFETWMGKPLSGKENPAHSGLAIFLLWPL